ncbi:MAG TPA: hypothetical protein PKW62_01105 [Chitinophagaceae bacterium]|nr:hypothetical protein [Chitinophagaceae bacterium]
MRWLLFLSRLAFICGLFFLLTLLQLFTGWIKDGNLESTIITIGFFIGLIIVPLTLLCYLFLWMMGKKPNRFVPVWLMIANVIVLCILLFYIFYINSVHVQTLS